MSSLSILYLGADSGTSLHRAQALRRLGHKVRHVDPLGFLPRHRVVDYWVHHTGSRFISGYMRQQVLKAIGSSQFDLAFIDAGAGLNPRALDQLRCCCSVLVNYNADDPFGHRDGLKWRLYLESVSHYDLVIVVRDSNVQEAIAAGARQVMKVFRSADEVAHAPRQLTINDYSKWQSDVIFIGTWMPERGAFFVRLRELGVPLTIYGDRWSKAPEWPVLKRYWRGPGLYRDDDYARAIQCAGVCLGLLSKGNRDLSTSRSFEIPHFGSVFCGERTSEHSKLYEDGVEAIFWSTPEECAEKCRRLLADEEWRNRVALNGRARCLANRTTNEQVLADILERIKSSDTADRMFSSVAN